MSGAWFKTLRVGAATAAVAVVAFATAQAQNAVIRGTVTSDGGQPIGGANVYLSELGTTAVTTDNGRYTLTVAGDRVRNQQLYLRVRAIGYRPNSRLVTLSSGEQQQDFTLATDISRLEEIVVTGVLEGTEKAKVPFAVARVDLADVPVPPIDPLRAIAGRVPGANVISSTGRPGAAPEVILRGPHSINASGRNQGPLYIVDGVVLQGDGNIQNINPADIENVEVVNGAAASSLYGARGGNGVIQITTRSARRTRDGMTFSVAQEVGTNDIERDFGLARNHTLLMDARNERFCRNVVGFCATSLDWNAEAARVNNAPGDFALTPQSLALDPGAGTPFSPLRNNFQAKRYPGRIYNAVDQAITNNPLLQTNLDASGRYGETQFFVSGSMLDQGGALRFIRGFQRYTGRLNVDQRIGSLWSVGFRSYYMKSFEDLNAPSFFRLTRAPGIVNILQRDTLGRLYVRTNIQGGGSQNENPLQSAAYQSSERSIRRFIGNLTTRFQPAPWFDLEGQFGYDFSSTTDEFFRDKGYRTTASGFNAYIGSLSSGEGNSQSYNTNLNATLRHNFGRNVASKWVLRAAYDQQDNDSRGSSGNTLNAVGVQVIGNAQVLGGSSGFTSVRGTSFAGGANFEIAERYILDGIVRREGSSLFGADARWSTFGRGSVAWRLSREPWWFAPGLFSDLKLRASYGTAGGRPSFSAQYETFSVSAGGIGFGTLGNSALRPEKTYDTELGLDAELFRRIGVNLTYARSETRDQILQVVAPAEKGFATQWQNAGTMENRTWEASVNVPLLARRDMSWTWRFSYDRTRTRITELFVPPQRYGAGSQATTAMFLLQEGELYGTFYGKRFITDCSDLPDHSPYGGQDFRTLCGTSTSQFQRNSDGFIVWTGGYGVGEGITRNLWTTSLASAGAPWGRPLNWGMPISIRDTLCVWSYDALDEEKNNPANRIAGTPSASCAPLQVPLGHALPDWNFSVSQNFTWRRLSVFAMLQGVMGRDVWNQGRHWAHLDFLSRDLDQEGLSVEEAKPIGYYWRASTPDATGLGGFYDILAPNNRFVEDASYAKLRELSLSYNVGPVGGVGNWTASVVGRNLFTITNYTGFDPEVGQAAGLGNSGLVGAVDAFNFPNTRSFTFRLSTSF